MDRPLKIVHCVEGYPPSQGGMAEVVRQLSERMAAQGHHVTVFTSAHAERPDGVLNGVHVRGFAVTGNMVRGMHGAVDAYREAVMRSQADVVVLFAAQQWATDALIDRLGYLPGRKLFVPTGFSGLNDAAYADYFRRMPEWLQAMDLNIFHSTTYQDVVFARAHGAVRSTLIPNGAAEEEFNGPPTVDVRRELGIGAAPLIVHVGSYTGLKGQREAMAIHTEADVPGAVLLLIGNGNARLEQQYRTHWRFLRIRALARWRRRRVIFREWDRERTVAAMKQADLFLFPSQVECSPIVLFESAAAGVPFLASEAGNAAEIAAWTGAGATIRGERDPAGRVHVDVRTGARLLTEWMRDPQRREQAGAAGRAAWAARFTWARITRQYLDAYGSTLTAPRP